MNIELTPKTQKLLDDKLKSGEFQSADQVVHAALMALDKLDSIALDDITLDAIDRAEEQIERGQVYLWNDVRGQVRSEFLKK